MAKRKYLPRRHGDTEKNNFYRGSSRMSANTERKKIPSCLSAGGSRSLSLCEDGSFLRVTAAEAVAAAAAVAAGCWPAAECCQWERRRNRLRQHCRRTYQPGCSSSG